jgi:ElaA protein
MKIVAKKYNDSTLDELFEILKVRAEVFVVEQKCNYQDMDDIDKCSIHIFMIDKSGIQAYLRLIEPGKVCDYPAIGRVLSKVRRKGYATEIMKVAISEAKKQFNAARVKLSAQVYVRELYDKLGFKQTSEEFLDVGIPHIDMILDIE